MAEIFLARPVDVALSKLVALKRILPDYSDRANFREMFVREGEIALRFRHPSIVTVHEIGQVGRDHYMTMEYFPGKTLAQLTGHLRDGKGDLDVSEKVYIIKSIADALQYIHDFSDYGDSTEIIHRDISPQNIMVGFDGAAKLIDFGVAKVNTLERGTDTKDIKGKFAYMSPEQIRGDKLTKRTDIFSLGIVFWELLNKRKLFTGKMVEDVTKQVINFEEPKLVDFSTEVPYALCKICQKCLAIKPGDRYQSAGELARELDEFLRKSSEGSQQRRVAEAMSRIFPDDVGHLRAQLKRYEQRSGDETVLNAKEDTDTLKLDDVAPPRRAAKKGESSSSARSRSSRKSTASEPKVSSRRQPRQSSWVTPASWLLVISGGLIAIGAFMHGLWPRPSGVASGKKPKTEKTEMASVPPPSPPVEFERIVINPTPMPVPPAAPVPAPAPPTKPSVRIEKKVVPPPIVEKPLAKKSERKKKTGEKPRVAHKPTDLPKNERKVAATARPPVAPQATAVLTILADPDAQIFVDDKNVGTELANNIKVTADKKLVIKVVGKGGQPVKTQTLTLKPFSNNVIEMGGGPP